MHLSTQERTERGQSLESLQAPVHLQHQQGRIQACSSSSTEMAKPRAVILSPPAAGADVPQQAPLQPQGLIVREPQPLGGRALRTGVGPCSLSTGLSLSSGLSGNKGYFQRQET